MDVFQINAWTGSISTAIALEIENTNPYKPKVVTHDMAADHRERVTDRDKIHKHHGY